jgi:hypothetical protein|tara:strand:- start:1886 stop:2080 length:195 start_codon:yes stop_codon:yes gene_type:complete
MTDLEQVFINFSKREIKLMDNEGNDKVVNWRWDDEGLEGFTETVSEIQDILDPDMLTYCFSVKE